MTSLYAAIVEAQRNGQPVAMATVIRARGSVPRGATARMLIYPDGRTQGTVGGGELEHRVIQTALEVLRSGQARLEHYSLAGPRSESVGVCGGEMEVFIEPILPPPQVLILGAGHVGKAVAHLARWLGFRVIVADDRPELCTPEQVPDADELLVGSLGEVVRQVPINAQTYVISVTRSYTLDVETLPYLLETEAAYIGVIGSRRRWVTATKALQERGVPEEAIRRIHSPIGLAIHAETPEEIAVSIMAEIIQVRNRRERLRSAPAPSAPSSDSGGR
ncbi:MAG TPA: xanthine dehydrogenase [Chloroflexi bacterium]|nr:xanthine dehydrogenase [Chloroflexota bacterium]